MSAYNAYTPTGAEKSGPGIFQGDVSPQEGSVLMRIAQVADGSPQSYVKLCDEEDAPKTSFFGVVTKAALSVLGTVDGDPIYGVNRGLVKALVRGGAGVDKTPLVMHEDGYFIAAVGDYSGDTNAVAELQLTEGGTHTADGLALVYVYGPSA